MSLSVVCETSGCARVVRWPQNRWAERLGGALRFVGAVPALDVFLVGLAACDDEPVNPLYAECPGWFHVAAPRGAVVAVASDADGVEADVDADAFARSRECARRRAGVRPRRAQSHDTTRVSRSRRRTRRSSTDVSTLP